MTTRLAPPPARRPRPRPRPRRCHVCGDAAHSLHFGGLSCDSCKAFFRRSVQSGAWRAFRCPGAAVCEVTVASRRCCQACRYNRCLQAGMEPGWVLSERERHRDRHRKTARLTPNYAPDISELSQHLCSRELQDLAMVRDALHSARAAGAGAGAAADTVSMLVHFCQLMVRTLCTSSAHSLLVHSVLLEACLLYIGGQPHLLLDNNDTCGTVDVCTTLCYRLSCEREANFIRGLSQLHLDDTCLSLLIVILLMNPDLHAVSEHTLEVQVIQENYLLLLQRYMAWQYGPALASRNFPKLLTKLGDVQELSESRFSCTPPAEYSADVLSCGFVQVIRGAMARTLPTISAVDLEGQQAMSLLTLCHSHPEPEPTHAYLDMGDHQPITLDHFIL